MRWSTLPLNFSTSFCVLGDQVSQLGFNARILLKQVAQSCPPHDLLFGLCPFKIGPRQPLQCGARSIQPRFGRLDLCA